MTASRSTDEGARASGETPEPESYDEVVEIRFAYADATSELVDATLWSTGCAGSIVGEDGADVVVTAWIPEASRGEALAALHALEGVSAAIVRRPRVDWLARYEQSLAPILVGERFVVAPKRELVETGARIPIIIPQEQAFGTGSHESTAMCLELLESLDLRGARGLDVGTGSGILAIAMAKLGAAKVLAFDNDPEALPVVSLNLERNAVADGRILAFLASGESLGPRGRFDAVTMNILPSVIAELLPHVAPTIVPGGALIVSGILVEQRDGVVADAAAVELSLAREIQRGEWWAGLLKKPA